MWEEILKMAVNYGLMSALFVALLVWVLRDARNREIEYQSAVKSLHKALEVVHYIQQGIKEIHEELIRQRKENKVNGRTAKKTVEED